MRKPRSEQLPCSENLCKESRRPATRFGERNLEPFRRHPRRAVGNREPWRRSMTFTTTGSTRPLVNSRRRANGSHCSRRFSGCSSISSSNAIEPSRWTNSSTRSGPVYRLAEARPIASSAHCETRSATTTDSSRAPRRAAIASGAWSRSRAGRPRAKRLTTSSSAARIFSPISRNAS